MKHLRIITAILFTTIFMSCTTEKSKTESKAEDAKQVELPSDTLTKHLKPFRPELPTIGLLMYEGVLQGEVIATSDVFAKLSEKGKYLFNVITTEEVMHFVPDFTFDNCPKLTALFVASGYDMYAHVRNEEMIDFIKRKNEETKYMVSNCAGTQLIGKSGTADDRKIVNYIGGGK